ncbi:MAG TPA: sigma-70 family RNA polymerase sigma factor [Planctomycetaceae bacterium]|nr:sigma-70 family RNA polymerase sigma factor [Planctomycetaceae bacterium]HIQ23184.1 sigma-70 family RNA polymerase sigma factor [Planctomycetota bacterium]
MQPRVAQAVPRQEWSDEDLLLEYRSCGDRRAFEELVHRYEHELYNYLRRFLGDAELAEDAFQATFLQVYLKCDRFEAGRRVRPWLYTVATNQAIDAQRRNRRHRMISLDGRPRGSGDGEDAPALVDLIDGSEPDPFERLESAERGEEVRRAVEELPEPLRQVLLLVYYQGMKYREAAEVLDIPVGTVKSRLHSAIRKLNHALNSTEVPQHG